MPFQPGLPPIGAQPEFVQDLHAIWDQEAFAWENEERSIVVQTFFVDHTDVIPTCSPGRSVRLYGSYNLWTEQLKSVWPDKVRAGRPIEFPHCIAYATTGGAWYRCLCLDGASTR